MNVVRDLVSQIVLHFRFNLFLVERVDCGRIHTVSAAETRDGFDKAARMIGQDAVG